MHAPIRVTDASCGLVPDRPIPAPGPFLDIEEMFPCLKPWSIFRFACLPCLHEQLASWAKDDKASLNALIVGILEKAIEVHEKSGHKE